MGVGTVTHYELCNYSGTSEAPIIWYLISHEMGKTIFALGETKLSQYRWEIGWEEKLGRPTYQDMSGLCRTK